MPRFWQPVGLTDLCAAYMTEGQAAAEAAQAFAQAMQRSLEHVHRFCIAAAEARSAPQAAADLASALAGELLPWTQSAQPLRAWGEALAGMARQGGIPLTPLAPLPGASMQPLLENLGQLHSRLSAYWSRIAVDAAREFTGRLAERIPQATLESVLELFELWIECAERAYASVVSREEYSRVQAQWLNGAAALLLEQRSHAQQFARALGMPTRAELDALHGRVRELGEQLRSARAPRAPRARSGSARAPGRRRPKKGTRR